MAKQQSDTSDASDTAEGKGREELDERIEDKYGSLPDNLAKEMKKIPAASNAEQKGKF